MRKESLRSKTKRVEHSLSLLKRYHPRAKSALYYKNPFQLLVATILSAQCTDKRVNMVTKSLFKKYPTVGALAKADLKDLESQIHSTGFFRAKARNIKRACQKIQKNFKGLVPKTLKELLTLPGVGRKTAHVILGTAFKISSGVVVDTHVGRLSLRLGFTGSQNPEQVEKDLCALLKRKDWIYFSHALILHGRGPCKARRPRCSNCFLQELCPKIGVEEKPA